MATPAQQLSLATLPPMPMMKWISPPSSMDYLPLLDTLPNTTSLSSVETWIEINNKFWKQMEMNYKFCLHNLPKRNG